MKCKKCGKKICEICGAILTIPASKKRGSCSNGHAFNGFDGYCKICYDKVHEKERNKHAKINKEINELKNIIKQLKIIPSKTDQNRKIQEAIEDNKIIKVYDPLNEETKYMTALQYEEFLINGGKYNRQTYITTMKQHAYDTTNYRHHGKIGGITYGICKECDKVFFYIYRGGGARQRCWDCVDWDKLYKYDDITSRIFIQH